MRTIRFFVLFLFFFLLFSISVEITHVKAQDSSPSSELKVLTKPQGAINMTISPTYVNLTTQAGKEVSSQFSVTNNNAFTEYYKVSLMKFDVSNGDKINITQVKNDDPFSHWISFSQDRFAVDSNGVKTVKFTIKPSEDAALGYYYGIMVSRLEENTQEGKSSITGAPLFSVLLEVQSDNEKREMQFADFTMSSMFYEYLPAELNVKVKNTGNIHLIPSGDIFIDWGRKKDVAILPVNPGRGNVLPQAERTFTVNWDDAFAVRGPKTVDGKIIKDKNGNTEYEVKYDLTKADKFRIGKYTAHVLMVYDNGQRDVPIEGTVSFWVFPWKIVLAGLAVVLLALAGIRSIISSVFRKK